MKPINKHRATFALILAVVAISLFIASTIIYIDGSTTIVSDALNATFRHWFGVAAILALCVLAAVFGGKRKGVK